MTVIERADESIKLDDAELSTQLGRLNNSPADKDRLRLIKAMSRNFTLDCSQAAQLVRTLHAPDVAVDACEIIVTRLVDPENIEVLVSGLSYEQSRAELRSRLSL
mmetsp:Transcript_3999/g.5617  ORF Transcript_3999/g.5617 Transcript_3999/m.5617 type:complete len:105 (+) Transcript_3999:82-396(+)